MKCISVKVLLLLGLVLFVTVHALGQEFQQSKILNVSSLKEEGPSTVLPNNGYPIVIPSSDDVFTITVAISGMAYSGEYPKKFHFNPADLIVGDSILARVDGSKLVLKTAKGKEVRGKIIRRARLDYH